MSQPVEDYKDTKAVEKLISDHLPDIVTLCNRMLPNLHDAEDAAQQAVIRIIRGIHQYRKDAPIRHWILKVTRHAVLDYCKSRQRSHDRERKAMPPVQSEDASLTQEEHEILRHSIAALPEDLQTPVTLYYFHKISQQDIAGIVGCSQPTIKSRLDKAVRLLRDKLQIAGFAAGVPLTSVLSQGALDPVPHVLQQQLPALVAAESTALATGAVSATTLATTGGIIMKVKLAIAAVTIATLSFFGGVTASSLPSDPLIQDQQQPDTSLEHSDLTTAEWQSKLNALSDKYNQAVADAKQWEGQSTEMQSAIEANETTISSLQYDLAQANAKVKKVLEDNKQLRPATLTQEEVTSLISESLATMLALQSGDGNQLQLGIKLVADLSKISSEDIAALVQFDEVNEDKGFAEKVSTVLLYTMIFNGGASKEIQTDYMNTYIDRLEQGTGFSPEYREGALNQISWASEPYANAFNSIVAPLEASQQQRLLDIALEDFRNQSSPAAVHGAIQFFAGMDHPKATNSLISILHNRESNPYIQQVAIKGLSTRTPNQGILDALRSHVADYEAAQNPKALAFLMQSIAKVEKALKKLETNR